MSIKWERLGDQVGLTAARIEGIKLEHHGRNEDCMRAVATEWIRTDPEVSIFSHHFESSDL